MSIELIDDSVSLERLCLDPNNPRFEDVDAPVPIDRVPEATVQARALERMLRDEFEVDQLAESIRSGGYKTVNAIVVDPIPGTDRFKVVEGNRRLAALTVLKRDSDEGTAAALSDDLSQLLNGIPVKRIEGGTPEERLDYIEELLGTLHVPGTKAWKPYQQSQRVGKLLERGWPAAEIRSRLGISQPRFTSLRRAYVGMRQMRTDPVYGGYVKASLFSQFEEALSKPKIRIWLGWDEDDGITDAEARERYYSWITSIDQAGNAVPAKIVDAKDFRLLPKLLDDPTEFERFVNDQNLTLEDAADRVVVTPRAVDWRAVIAAELGTLRSIPAVNLAEATDEEVGSLEALRDVCETLLRTIEMMRPDEDESATG